MSKPVFIIGNGLSIALSPDFSIKSITEKFIDTMEDEDKKFLERISHSAGREINFDDFEENFAALDIALESLTRYCGFIDSNAGKEFLVRYSLKDPELHKHLDIMKRIYDSYIIYILKLIHGKVHLKGIEENIFPFVNFIKDTIKSVEKAYIFTLNYDLLIETILLERTNGINFTDFCFPCGKFKKTEIDKFDFNPARNKLLFEESQRIELHHLHGSLSLFYDYYRNKVFKLRSNDISLEEIYNKIRNEDYNVMPAIITGGGKSHKIIQYPFEYYYTQLKNICDSGSATALYVVGYSFRDKHINDLINRWTKKVVSYKDGLRIIDFQTEGSKITEYMENVRSIIKRKNKVPDECFEFRGVNHISSCPGTSPKIKKKVETP